MSVRRYEERRDEPTESPYDMALRPEERQGRTEAPNRNVTIRDWLEQLQKSSSVLGDLISQLTEKLAPVTGPITTQAKNASASAEPVPDRSEYALMLSGLLSDSERKRRMINELMSGLEV